MNDFSTFHKRNGTTVSSSTESGTCNSTHSYCTLVASRNWVSMKGIVASICSVVLFGTSFTPLVARADNLYVSVGVVLEFNSNGNESTFANAGLDIPEGLVLDSSGDLFVANGGNSTIEEFNSSGTGSVFATASSGLSFPTGLAFDGSGDLFVANSANNTIEKFSTNGVGSVFATASSGLDIPEGLAFDSSGNLYVANNNNTILKFNPSGTGVVFAASGLSNPFALAFNSAGNLYVANAGNHSIEEFDPSGTGSLFSNTNALFEPEGLAFDSSGNLYVGNRSSTGSILEFNPEGDMSVFASGFGDPTYLADQIPEPSSLLLLGLGLCGLALSHRPRHR
jgi:sugar lactone lactonase YvrE